MEKNNDTWCHYSDLPSPLDYVECADYDSMGNHGRFPKKKLTKKSAFDVNKEKLLKVLSSGKLK
jgi:hypothetical protein